LIQGRTLCDDPRQTAEERGDEPAFSDRAGGQWKTLTWSQARQRALELAAGFVAVGCRPGDRVALMLPNRVEHVLADLGALHAGAVPVTLYATFAPEQVAYVAADCAARVAVLDGADQLSRWQPVLERLPRLHAPEASGHLVGPPFKTGGRPPLLKAGHGHSSADTTPAVLRQPHVAAAHTPARSGARPGRRPACIAGADQG
jgi:acyl-CoA synthetase (AMP-forming)/AMP-acid ligase II